MKRSIIQCNADQINSCNKSLNDNNNGKKKKVCMHKWGGVGWGGYGCSKMQSP